MTGPQVAAQRAGGDGGGAMYLNDGSGSASVYYPTSKYDRMLRMNPGRGFAKPDAWMGPAPVWFTDAQYEDARNSTKNYMKTGDGWYIAESTYHGSYQYEPPAGAVRFWELPIYNGPQMYEVSQFADNAVPLSNAELEAKFGTAAANKPYVPPANSTPQQDYAASPAAAAERARQAVINAAADAERARLADEAARANALAQAINSGTPPATATRIFTLTPPGGTMLNAMRPVDDTRPMTGDAAVTLDSAGNYSAPQQLPTNNTTALAPGDWKKYLPFALGAIALVLLIVVFKPKKGAATS